MKKLLTLSLFVMMLSSAYNQSVILTFTGQDDNGNRCPLSRVEITNHTRGWQETLLWPDTVLTLQNGVGIVENIVNNRLSLAQNSPNPFAGTTFATLSMTEVGAATINLTDINGRIIATTTTPEVQNCCVHKFCIHIADPGVYFLTAQQNGHTSSIKMVNESNGGTNAIDYQGSADEVCLLKNETKGLSTRPFEYGDLMQYVGYANIKGIEMESQQITQLQGASQTFTFQFVIPQELADGAPCPGDPILTDVEGNVYHTVFIGVQCWMKENLKTKKYADNTSIPYGYDTSSVIGYWYYSTDTIYGLLYNWKAVMKDASSSNTNPSAVQGICPTGWHVPSDAEWTQLTDYLSTQSQYWCSGNTSYTAKALASTTHWWSCESYCRVGNDMGSNNATGFSALPAGSYSVVNWGVEFRANFWSTTSGPNGVYGRGVNSDYPNVCRGGNERSMGFSVRCLRD